jgi:hypothetical protein
MTHERDIDRLLDLWMLDGPTEVADRVVLDAAARIDRQPQRPAWRFLGRPTLMNSSARWIAAAAAVILIAVVGFAVLGRPSDAGVGGSPPTASPPPSISPTPSSAASPAAEFPAWFTGEHSPWAAGILPAGRYSPRHVRTPSFAFTVPAGWVNGEDSPDDIYTLFPDTPANAQEFARSGDLAQDIFIAPTDTPAGLGICPEAAAAEPSGPRAAQIAEVLVATEALSVTAPVPVTIGGLSGLQMDIRIDPDWTGTCTAVPQDPPTRDYKDVRARYIVLDLADGGNLIVDVRSVYSTDFEPFLAEAMSIVESMEFDAAAP